MRIVLDYFLHEVRLSLNPFRASRLVIESEENYEVGVCYDERNPS